MSPAGNEGKKQKEFVRRFQRLGLDELVLKEAHNWAGYLRHAGETAKFSACTFPWNALVVFFNGVVAPCAQDFFGACRLGDAASETLLGIWNGPPMQELRRAFVQGNISGYPACDDCDRVRRRTLGGIPREYLKRMLFRHMP
jgi:hypothetical protein